jgi:hypothetical protein
MKKVICFFMLMPLFATQCSDSEVNSDCGCNSLSVVKLLNDATATIRRIDPTSTDKHFYIYLDEFESNAEYFSTLSSCDSLLFNNDNFQEETKIRISGEIKPVCSNTHIKIGSSPVVITKIEILEVDSDN